MGILALHGFAQTPAQWSAAGADLAPWISGHGTETPRVRNFDEEVERLIRLASKLSAPRILLGYSQGARLGLAILEAAPDLFARAVLVGVHPGLETEVERAARRGWEGQVARLLREQGLAAFWEYWGQLPTLAAGPTRPRMEPVVDRIRRSAHSAEGLAWAMETLGLGAMPNLWSNLDAIKARVDFVVGALDSKFMPIAERAWARVPRARVRKIPEAAHNPLLDTPDAMGRLLREIHAP